MLNFIPFPEPFRRGEIESNSKSLLSLASLNLYARDEGMACDESAHVLPYMSEHVTDDPPHRAAWPAPLPPMRMLQLAYLGIIRHLSSVEPEAGGMLLGPKESSVVTHYVIDGRGKATAASFTLDATGLNAVLKKALECNLDCKGLVHSHPPGCNRPSSGDLAYVRKSFANDKNKDLSEFLLPIFCDGVLIPYLVRPHEEPIVQMAQLVLF